MARSTYLSIAIALCSLLTTSSLPSAFGGHEVFDIRGFYPQQIVFVRVPGVDAAVEMLQRGTIHLFLDPLPVPSSAVSKGSLQTFEAVDRAYALVFNPAPADDRTNPFAHREFRVLAARHLLNRSKLVGEVLEGAGHALALALTPWHPDYRFVVDIVDSWLQSSLAPGALGRQRDTLLEQLGYRKLNEKWTVREQPILLRVIDVAGDPKTSVIARQVAEALGRWGFQAQSGVADEARAWHVRVEAFNASQLAPVVAGHPAPATATPRNANLLLGRFYGPSLLQEAGLRIGGAWVYENSTLEQFVQALQKGDYKSELERVDILRKVARMALSESVRVFLMAQKATYLYNEDLVLGLENVGYDFFAGPRTFWFYRTAKLKEFPWNGQLRLGQTEVHGSAYNPVAGFTDPSSLAVWLALYDPPAWPGPHTGEWIANRVERTEVEVSAGDSGRLVVPEDAVKFVKVDSAASRVAYRLKLSRFQHGPSMTVADLLYSITFAREWSSQLGPEDLRYDPAVEGQMQEAVRHLLAIRIRSWNATTGEVEGFYDLAHPDPISVASLFLPWTSVPWELGTLMETVVEKGEAAFSSTVAEAKGVPWLDLTREPSLSALRSTLRRLGEANFIPSALRQYVSFADAKHRWTALATWEAEKGHFLVTSGPYLLAELRNEEGWEELHVVRDPSYPYMVGSFDHLAYPRYAQLREVTVPQVWRLDQPLPIRAIVEVQELLRQGRDVSFPFVPAKSADVQVLVESKTGVVALRKLSEPQSAGIFEIVFQAHELRSVPEVLRVLVTATAGGVSAVPAWRVLEVRAETSGVDDLLASYPYVAFAAAVLFTLAVYRWRHAVSKGRAPLHRPSNDR